MRAFLHSENCRAIVEALRDGGFTLITSNALVEELATTLRRPKFAGDVDPEDVRALLELIHDQAEFVPPRPVTVAVRDPKDRPVIACAYAADVLVSGDGDLQILERVDSTLIVSPAKFLDRLSR